jgi:hypothetical protein
VLPFSGEAARGGTGEAGIALRQRIVTTKQHDNPAGGWP